MRRSFILMNILIFGLVLAAYGRSFALDFPVTYTGNFHVKQEFTNQYGTGTCAGGGALTIVLTGDGSLTYTAAVVSISTHDSPGQPRSCEIIPKGYSETINGKHDGNGRFDISFPPVGSLIIPPITGSYDANHITGSRVWTWEGGEHTINFDLPAISQAPKITLEPADYPTFQANVLMGEGFTIHIRKKDGVKDAQGNWKLNWGSLRFATNGMANSDHFINTVAAQEIVSTSVGDKDVRFHVKPDPKKFMDEHNVFDIKANGNHLLGFKICDTEGRCGESQYDVYFGPMILTGGKAAERCWLGPDNIGNYKHAFDIEWIAYANVGHWSTGEIFAGVLGSDGKFWFFEDGGLYSNYSAPSDLEDPILRRKCPGIVILTGDICIKDYQTYRFEMYESYVSGPMTFYVGIWDKPANILKYHFTTLDLCK